MSRLRRRVLGLLVVVVATFPLPIRSGAGAGAAGPLRVRASPAVAACLGPVVEAFAREVGVAAVLDVAEPDPPGDADVIVGDDAETTRLLEGGIVDYATTTELGYVPWVLVVPVDSEKASLSSLTAADRVWVLGGRVGHEARLALGALPADRVRVSRDRNELVRAPYALVPRSLAGAGRHHTVKTRPLTVSASAVFRAAHLGAARSFLSYIQGPRGRSRLSGCILAAQDAGVSQSAVVPGAPFAVSVVDWWLPDCTLQFNRYNDPQKVLGSPDAQRFGVDAYDGMMSLGQAGFVTVDMGVSVVDVHGADVRVFQTTSSEPVSLYASTSPRGPFTLIALRRRCGDRTVDALSNHCDFDLQEGGITQARYFRVEDGEIYPCLAGGTRTEGADIDAIEVLSLAP